MRIRKIEDKLKDAVKLIDPSTRTGKLTIPGEAYEDVREAARRLNYTGHFPYMFVVFNDGETIEFHRDDVKSHDLLSIGPLMQQMYDQIHPRNKEEA